MDRYVIQQREHQLKRARYKLGQQPPFDASTFGGWFGGRLIYEFGVAVKRLQ
jgi:hypothetical protein